MTTARLTRSVTFRSAHRYYRPEWTDEENQARFGKCAWEHGHGHTYRCLVTVQGVIDDATGMVIDLEVLDRVLQREVVDVFDHRHINLDVPEFAFGKTIPTCEALSVAIWHRISSSLPDGVHLYVVRVDEEDTLYAEYFGESEATGSG